MSDISDYAIAQVIHEEGGFVNDSRDSGGATNMGITLNTLSLWRDKPCTVDDVKNLQPEEAKAIYKALYWDKTHGDDIKPAIAVLLFDTAVNEGVSTAIKLAQKTMNVAMDGVIGPQTMTALNKVDPFEFIYDFMAQRALLYMTMAGFSAFGRGWLRRLFMCSIEASNLVQPH